MPPNWASGAVHCAAFREPCACAMVFKVKVMELPTNIEEVPTVSGVDWASEKKLSKGSFSRTCLASTGPKEGMRRICEAGRQI